MEPLVYGVLAFVPGLLWLWVVWRKDDLEPEPLRLVMLVFGLGCLSAIATLWLRPFLEPLVPWDPAWLGDAVDCFVVTAAPEETLKFAAFFFGAFWRREMDEPLDGIVYGVAAGLGFASVESVLYACATGDVWIVLPRAFTATLAHVACSGALGFFVGLTRFRQGPGNAALVCHGVALAVVLHGAYDYFLLSTPFWWVALLILLPLMVVALGLKIRWARARSSAYHPHLAGERE